jgi:hypothetical protein
LEAAVRTALLLAAAWAFAAPAQRIRFVEVGEKAGVRHVHNTRKFQGKHGDVLGMFTSGGASAAAGDYDNDGDDDLFVVSSETGKPNKLYRNDGNFKFTEVGQEAGVAGGNDPKSIVADALWLDYDNDGWRDLLVARFGTPLLYHNERNGKFKDVTAKSGFNKFGNTIAAIAFDFDNDGVLDVAFGNYFKPVSLIDLTTTKLLPNDLDNAVNGGGMTLWKGRGDGTFVDVTAKAGLAKQSGWTLDLGHGDLNNDGWQDLYVACDYGTDRMFLNNGDGTFREVTEKAMGWDTRKGMNAELGDYDNDGFLDIYVTNITDEYMKECNMLWHNNGDGTFTDVSKETGTCNTLWGWAAKFGDWDNDGWLDIFATNGLRSAGKENYIPVLLEAIIKPGMEFQELSSWPNIGKMTWSGYQRKVMFRNLGGQVFKDISADAGVDNDLDGRGLAVADFDGDGLLDFYQTNADQPALMYRGQAEGAGNWLQLKLSGADKNRDAVGARVTVKAGGLTMIREVDGGNGYSGQSTQRLHFGLGKADKADSVEVRWPDGQNESIHAVANRYSHVQQVRGGPAKVTPGLKR